MIRCGSGQARLRGAPARALIVAGVVPKTIAPKAGAPTGVLVVAGVVLEPSRRGTALLQMFGVTL
jgi:hypothetical protein